MYFYLKMAPCYTLNYNWNILHCPINLLTTSAIVIQFLKKQWRILMAHRF